MTATPAETGIRAPSQDAGLAEALVDLSHHVLHLFADAGRDHKLSQQQVELVCAVIVRGSVGMTELGRLLHVEKSNLSNLVDRLEQRGLVVRTRDPNDRRATQVTLTDEGTAVAMKTYQDVAARVRRLLHRLPLDDQRNLAAVARKIVRDEPA
ncbi:MarR family winged helix-turn-helix transcriptional regulator [Frankia sp. QA3]|uniref:MarR family winged helix-turn-helix transcriptional regulator n=1 Tax=Frankia sp. QA3 TaxID=710111 RepID=UPI000269C108|nr:MarR family transcriptional regulator [Frankia sp. QA3]EIV92537.1 transcriptional regulator [Frankia sp. QA3]